MLVKGATVIQSGHNCTYVVSVVSVNAQLWLGWIIIFLFSWEQRISLKLLDNKFINNLWNDSVASTGRHVMFYTSEKAFHGAHVGIIFAKHAKS